MTTEKILEMINWLDKMKSNLVSMLPEHEHVTSELTFSHGQPVIGIDGDHNEFAVFIAYDKNQSYPFVCDRISESGNRMKCYKNYKSIRPMSSEELSTLENLSK